MNDQDLNKDLPKMNCSICSETKYKYMTDSVGKNDSLFMLYDGARVCLKCLNDLTTL